MQIKLSELKRIISEAMQPVGDARIGFKPHCDEENCGMGYAYYVCPKCGEKTEDFGDLWFEHNKESIDVIDTECERCGSKFTAHLIDMTGNGGPEHWGWAIPNDEMLEPL